jgi:sulfonate transport system substrate-binding protein
MLNAFRFFKLLAIVFAGLFGVAAHAADSYRPEVLRIGYQKYGTLVLLKARGDLDRRLAQQGVKVTWTEFTGGVRLLEGLNVGAVDFGTAGDAPPIFAQAAGAPLVYVGFEPPSPGGIALVVKNDSPIKSIKDIKGKKITVNKGGNIHYLLLRILEANGLKTSDVDIVYLPAADARPAFERGSVDAWVVWDPFLAHAQHTANARIVQDGTGLSPNYQFYFASETLAKQRPEVVRIVLDELRKLDEFAKNNIAKVAEQLAPEVGMDKAIIETALGRMGYGVKPLTPDVVASQQRVADTFHKAGLVPKLVSVKDAVWRDTQSAAR